MKVKATYFQNSQIKPIVFGDVSIYNIPRRKNLNSSIRNGILCETIASSFCGSDNGMFKLAQSETFPLDRFPSKQKRLINGHEGVVYIPSQKRFAIVLVRGGEAFDPTRFSNNESYFEYGCHQADGLMSEMNYYNPDMLLKIPDGFIKKDKIPLSLLKKLMFSDPFACMLFQLERIEDLGSAHNFRIVMAQLKTSEENARNVAKNNIFSKVVVFGLGTTGLIIGDVIHRNYPHAKIVFIGRSDNRSTKVEYIINKTNGIYIQNNFVSEAELSKVIIERLGSKATLFMANSSTDIDHRIAFHNRVLGNNGIYDSFSIGPQINFDSSTFGFNNYLLFGSVNFRQEHMEKAIKILCNSDYDELVEIVDFNQLKTDPISLYKKIYSRKDYLKSMVIWNSKYIDLDK